MTGSSPAPVVSCIVPVFNCARFLGEALDSIYAQSYRPIEVIVVDDGSTDDSADVAARYGQRLTLVRQENGGPGAARNTGFRLAKGEFIVSFLLPERPPHSGDCYMRLTPRTEMDIAIVGAAVNLTLDDSGTCIAARVSLGAVAPTPLLVAACADALIGTKSTMRR